MVFKGSSKRPRPSDISSEVDGLGAEFNAGTSKEYTNFYIKCRSGVVSQAFDVLSDMVLNPLLRADDIKREKGVIVEEIGMYEDNPRRHVYDIFEDLMFAGSSLGRNIAGTRDSVRGIEREDFVQFRSKHYHPKNLLVTVSGGITDKKALELTQKYFGNLSSDQGMHRYTDSITPFSPKQKAPQLIIKNQKREQANLILGFLGNKRGDQSRYAESVLGAILGGGMSSRLFTEIREKRGLAYTVRANSEHLPDTGLFQVYAGVDPKKAIETIKIILDQINGLVDGKYPITHEELSKAREFIKGHFALSLEDTEAINSFFGEEELIMGEIRTPDDVYKALDAVTQDQVLEVAKKLFVKSKLNLAIIGPFKSRDKFANIIA
jgi:predicted Zn-dependent peptidase